VGKDQIQHLEITRDIAGTFNRIYGETLVVPEVKVDERVMIIPGTDGQKMSKSYGNYIDIFQSDKALRKVVMTMKTDSTPIDEPKETSGCNVFRLYSLLADEDKIAEMKTNYATPGYGYGQAKEALFQLIVSRFAKERERFDYYMNHTNELEDVLRQGAAKARSIGIPVLERVRKKAGYASYAG
jgi:tryptophanyl-tRNA synthetase